MVLTKSEMQLENAQRFPCWAGESSSLAEDSSNMFEGLGSIPSTEKKNSLANWKYFMLFSGDLVGSKGSFVISKEAITQPTSAVTWQLSRGRFHCLLSRGKHAQHCYGMAVRLSLPSASWLNVLASWCVYTFPFSIHLATQASVILPIHESIRSPTYIRTRWDEIHIKWNSH